MTKEEAIGIIKVGKNFAYDEKYVEAFDIAIEALEQEPNWIPVTKELPKKAGQYLVTIQSSFGANFMEFANFSLDLSNVSRFFEKGRSGWWGCDDGGWDTFIYSGVIAWQPSPKPYESQESGAQKQNIETYSFPEVFGEAIEMLIDGVWVKGKVINAYRSRDGIVNMETADGKKYWCGCERTDCYRQPKEGEAE